MESHLQERGCSPVSLETNNAQNGYLLKLLVLLYADDTIILSESAEGLQFALNALVDYCIKWKLVINNSKTKIMIFQKRKPRRQPNFVLNGEALDIVDEFKYLGIMFRYNGAFTKCRQILTESATRALFFVLKKSQELSLDIDVSLHLFDSMVKPILTFGSEVWGFENLKTVERVQLAFCKYILRLNKSTPNVMVYGELGRYPIEIDIKVKMIKLWGKLVMNIGSTLSGMTYEMLYTHMRNGITSKWLSCIKSILENCGMAGIWMNQQFPSVEYIGEAVKQCLKDQFIQGWRSEILNSPKALVYKHVKTEFVYESYLNFLSIGKRITLCRFRCGNHKLPIEVGRHQRIPRDERICNKCNMGSLGDEFHFVLECPGFQTERLKLIPTYYWRHSNLTKYAELFNCESVKTSINLCTFLKTCCPG